MKIIKKENLYNDYKNANLTVSKYWEQVKQDGTLTNEELEAARKLTNKIFNIKKNINIDDIFIELFKINEENNTYNLVNQMGADIGGIETNELKVIFMNVEFGINIYLNNPKSEDVDKYLKIFELFSLGLENIEQYRKVLSYYYLEETFDKKPKIKQNKI